jgi:hypothetical protein
MSPHIDRGGVTLLKMNAPIIIRPINLKKISVVTIVFIFSLLIAPLYINGDQTYYREVYEKLPYLDIKEAFLFYKSKLSSVELTHFTISWIISPYIHKDLFVSISNAIFAYGLISLFEKWKASFWISLLIILTNYYILVMYFAAERLKFGFIFATFSLLYAENIKKYLIFCSLSIVSHIQMLIIIGSIVFRECTKTIKNSFYTGEVKNKAIFLLPIMIVPLYIMWDQIVIKFAAYYGSGGLEALGKAFVFFLLSINYAKKKSEAIFLFIPIFIAIFLVGGERVNIFGYFIFLYYGLNYRGGRNIGVVTTSIYYGYNAFIFLLNIIASGEGFIAND